MPSSENSYSYIVIITTVTGKEFLFKEVQKRDIDSWKMTKMVHGWNGTSESEVLIPFCNVAHMTITVSEQAE